MEFVREIRKLQVRGESLGLSQLEKAGDPQGLAAAFCHFGIEKEMVRIGPPRASGLYEACMRLHVIGSELSLRQPEFLDLRTRLIYGIGNAVHHWAQNTPFIFGDRRFGWWKCVACGKTLYFGAPPKKPCSHCGARPDAIFYEEHSFHLRGDIEVSGHIDLFFKTDHAETKLRIAEIKTLAGDEYDTLKAPLVEHDWQFQCYLLGVASDKRLPVSVDHKVGYIVYVTKRGNRGEFPVKVFPVARNRDLVVRIKEKLALYVKGTQDYPNHLPPLHEECARGRLENYRAKTCPALKECRSHG